MAWSAITSVITYSAGNAVPLSNNANEPITVRLRHPGTGSDGIVTFYDDAGAPIQTATVTKTNPISEIAFRTSSSTLNYSTNVAFDAPGLTIEPIGLPLFSTDGLSVSSSLPIKGPSGAVAGSALKYDLPNLRKKLADVASNAGECIIGVIGDSHNLAVGGGTSGTYLLVDACKYAPAFVAGRKLAGALGIPVNDDGWWGWRGYNTLVTLDQFDPRVVTTGTWTSTSSSNTGLGSGALRETSGSGTYTYTAKRNWDKAEIWVQQNTGATGTIVASATGATSVPLTLLSGAAALTKFTLTKSAVDANPLVLTCSVAMSAYVGVAAINFINTKEAAVRIQNHAMSGKKMTDHIVASHPYSNLNAYQTAGLASDVLLVECLHNSILAAAETLEVWLASWETFLAAMDTATRDIVVYIGYPGNYTWATDGTMDTWIAALKVKLDARGINMLDLRSIYGTSWAAGNSEGLMYDSGHPNKRGLALYGAKMAADLLGVAAPW